MLQDLRYALRSLRKSPGFTTAAVLTLALGIGANTAIFSVVDGVLLRSSPFEDIGRLMVIWETDRKSGTTREPASVPDYLDFRERTARFGELAAMAASEVNLTPDDGDPARLAGLLVTHEYFGLLGLVPVLGRAFMDEEDQPGGPAVVLIGEDLWERLFSRDPAVVERLKAAKMIQAPAPLPGRRDEIRRATLSSRLLHTRWETPATAGTISDGA